MYGAVGRYICLKGLGLYSGILTPRPKFLFFDSACLPACLPKDLMNMLGL